MFKDKIYLNSLLKIGLPIALQQLLFASFSLLDTVMMGQMGENAIAAVGLANQVTFVYNLIIFGVNNGASIFASQYWGVKDIKGIHKVMRLTLILSILVGLFFMAVALFAPEIALGFYTDDPAVIRLGAEYLRIISLTYLVLGISYTYTIILRTTHHVQLPTTISVIALAFNILLNYILIFGKLGLPQMGVSGAALGTLIVRLVQVVVLISLVYLKKLPAAITFKGFFQTEKSFIRTYFKTSTPVLINETLWSLAITTINAIYAHISTEAIAAININTTVEQFFYVLAIGIANATGILVGNEIGAGRINNAKLYAKRSAFLIVGVTMIMGGIVLGLAPTIISFYKVSPLTKTYALRLMRTMGLVLWIRAMLMNWVIGILRPGGDTRFTLLVDGVIIWAIGVPMAYLGAHILHLPVYWVYLMVVSEEVVKNIICTFRFRSGKWITKLTETNPPDPIEALSVE